MGTASVMLKADRGVYVGTVYQHKGISLWLFHRHREGYSLPLPYVTLKIIRSFSGFGIPRLGDFWGIPRKNGGFFKKSRRITPFRLKFYAKEDTLYE